MNPKIIESFKLINALANQDFMMMELLATVIHAIILVKNVVVEIQRIDAQVV